MNKKPIKKTRPRSAVVFIKRRFIKGIYFVLHYIYNSNCGFIGCFIKNLIILSFYISEYKHSAVLNAYMHLAAKRYVA